MPLILPWSYHRKSYFSICQLSKLYISYNTVIETYEFGIFWMIRIRTLRLEKENCIYIYYSWWKSPFNRPARSVLTKYEYMWAEKRKSYFGKNKVTCFYMKILKIYHCTYELKWSLTPFSDSILDNVKILLTKLG